MHTMREHAWRRISWAARLAVPMPLTTVVPNTMAPIVDRFRTDSANPDCATSASLMTVYYQMPY